MVNAILQKRFHGLQENYTKDGDIKMVSQLFRSFLNQLIRDYATLKVDGYHLDARLIPHEEKVLFLSHILDWQEYEDALLTDHRLDAVIKEYEPLMQTILENRMNAYHHEEYQEAGLKQHHYADNGEPYYV